MFLNRVVICVWFTFLQKVAVGNPCFFWESSAYFDGYCYKLGPVAVSWDDAQKYCGKYFPESKLAEPTSEISLQFAASMVILSGENWWIGGVIASSGQQKTPRWSSSLQTILSGNVSIYESGTCVQLTDSKKELLVPAMTSHQCSTKQSFICQLYVGKPCEAILAGGEYFTDGNCYSVVNMRMHWGEAKTTCTSQGSKLVEFYSEDPYYYFKNKLEKNGGREVFIPANTTLYLEDYGITMSAERGYFPFRIRTCGPLKVVVWSESSTTWASSHSPIGGVAKKHYVIEYGIANVSQSRVQYCNISSCRVLSNKMGVIFNCSKFMDLFVSWSLDGNTIFVSWAGLWVNFNSSKMAVLPLNRMAITTGNGNAIWMFEDPLYSSDVFLGGSDSLNEGVFTWLSTSRDVTIQDWRPGEPNDWPNDSGEDELCWRFGSYSYALNDVNGTTRTGRPFCQKELPMVTYLIVLHDSGTSEYKTSVVYVTSGNVEVVYLTFTQRMNTLETTETKDWVTAYRASVFDINNNIEMTDTDVYHGAVVLTSTDHVTVVLHQVSTGLISTTLVFPVELSASGYFILTNASHASGSHFSVTALQNNTEVVIKHRRDQSEPCIINFHGFSFQRVGVTTVTLDEFDTVHMMSSDDLSGSFVYSAKPISVYSGSLSVQGTYEATDSSIDMTIPVDKLSYYYITFPSPTPGVTNSETYRILALYDDTQITIFTSPVMNVTIAQAGHFTDVRLLSSTFYYMKSDSNHPFYVIKMAVSSSGVCATSLLPDPLWRSQYDIIIRSEQENVDIVLEKEQRSSLLMDGKNVHIDSCGPIEGSSLIGCSMQLGHGLHHIGFNDSRKQFVAYGSHKLINGVWSCNVLGASQSPYENSDQSKNTVQFPPLDYISLQEAQPFKPPNILGPATFYSETTEDTDTTQTIEVVNTDQITESSSENSELTTTDMAHMVVTSEIDRSTEVYPVTTEEEETFRNTPTASLTPYTSTQERLLKTTSRVNLSDCLPLIEHHFKLSKHEVDKITMEIVKLITINIRDTLAYKRKKKCTWEDRPSCHVIGISGSFIALTFLSFLLLSDLCKLAGHLWSTENRKRYNKDVGAVYEKKTCSMGGT